MNRLKNKVAIVTGGALGLGKAQCVRLAQEGAKVAVTDLREKEGRDVAEHIAAEGGEAKFWPLDVADEQQVEQTIRAVVEHFGRLDVLVNNAGITGADKPTDQLTVEEWEQVMAVNVRGPFLCTKHAIGPMRRAGGGSIVNLSSIYGIVSAPDVPAYHASKGAVRLMTKTDALLYASDRIRVNSVHPGFIWTPMVEHYAQGKDEPVEQLREKLESLHPLGTGEEDDIAWAVVFLASDESKWMTGSELVVDGGYTAR
jgi:NAD(P)-dependent dehydrogenase (short-subunit alcohol dehydrogenase family)